MRSGIPSIGPEDMAAAVDAGSRPEAEAESDQSPDLPHPTPRPKLMLRLFAGTGVVLAALVPIAALVVVILHLCHVLPFGHLA